VVARSAFDRFAGGLVERVSTDRAVHYDRLNYWQNPWGFIFLGKIRINKEFFIHIYVDVWYNYQENILQ
jgi:hypothetical protein